MKEIFHNIPEALLIIIFVYILSLFLDKVLQRFATHFDTSTSEIFRLLSNSQRALLLLVALIMAIGKLGFDVSALVAGLGLTGFALGFALKDAISNLIAGIMIVIYKPCEIGDLIEISGTKGKIMDINLRYLTISTESGKCLIPNSLILNNKLALFDE
jgi:small conductance mechanosensitive channel|tara:strand:+ start:62 stop:535 length:474 start_codon:yes stop_codon:yes gene_type:complete